MLHNPIRTATQTFANSMTSIFALQAIRFYQRFVSPYKGFRCAYGVVLKESSCSGYGYKVIQRFGLMTGLALLRRRFHDCSWCYNEKVKPHNKSNPTIKRNLFDFAKSAMLSNTNQSGQYLGTAARFRSQRGSVDCDCGGIDTSACDSNNSCGDKCNFSTPDLYICGIIDCPSLDCGPESKKEDKKFTEKRARKNEGKYDRLKNLQKTNRAEDKKESKTE